MKPNRITMLIGLSSILWLASCKSNKEIKLFDSQLLVNCWTHSHEEELYDGIRIYRPCDFKDFGPSRYRDKIDLAIDRTASYTVLSPVDAHTTEEGGWRYFSDEGILRILDNDGKFVRDYEIVELLEDKLSVKD